MEKNIETALQFLIRNAVKEELMASSATQQPSQPKDTKATVRGIRGLAEYCGISTATAQRLKSEGKIPYSQIGHRVYFCPADIDEALKVREA
uniref:DUF3853 family protein n=1 Tax=Alistipes sp. TaxID=1872444 RepID=UPI004056C276